MRRGLPAGKHSGRGTWSELRSPGRISETEAVMDLISWLSAVLGLFSDTLDAVFSVPSLLFFLVFLLFNTFLHYVAALVYIAKHF